MGRWLSRVLLIIGPGLTGLGMFELIGGQSFGRYGPSSRSANPMDYWINTGFHLVLGLALTIRLVKAFRNDRSTSDDSP